MKTPSLLVVLLLLTGCGSESDTPGPSPTPEPAEPTAPRPLRALVGETFAPLPTDVEHDMERVLLGRALYNDRRLSGDETISCATCHSLDHGGAEPSAVSTGIRGQQGPINSPTVLNAGFNFVQFWDGRAANLLEQAAGPVTNPLEMGGDWPTILERLRADDALVAQMTAEYGENAVTQANVLDALAAYEASLTTPSAFDRWLRGDDSALDEPAQRGLRAFVEIGCTTCHLGMNVGGSMYQRMGLVHDYFERRGGPRTDADNGRFNVTQVEADRHKFKVPTLRNVELTSPYFHDGSEPDLGGAVRTMAYVQLGRELEDDQVADLLAFLRSLTGELPEHARVPGDAGAAAPEGGAEAPTGATAD